MASQEETEQQIKYKEFVCSLINGSKQHEEHHHHHDCDADQEDHHHKLEFGPEEIAIARKNIHTMFPLANLPVGEVLTELCCFKKKNAINKTEK